ncbi:MAG: outer membrane beta-barrel family protein [Muribaculaceae bacterium]|nr:outer membrane beta-barrel family protein [Muribaculaceae bacterium]
MLRLWDSRDRLSAVSNMSGYCIGAVRNVALTMIQNRKPNIPVHTAAESMPADDDVFTDRNIFLTGGDRYSYNFNTFKRRNMFLGTSGFYNRDFKSVSMYTNATVRYQDMKNRNSNVDGTFAREQDNVTRRWLENIYSTDASSASLSDIVNRNIQSDSTRSHSLYLAGDVSTMIKIPKTNDMFGISVRADYTNEWPERFNNQAINYGADATPAVYNSQYFKNSPLHTLNIHGQTYYSYFGDNFFIQPNYIIKYEEKQKDSRLYALDHLSDMDVIGTIPAYMYYSYPDDANSYSGLHRTTSHGLMLQTGFNIGQVRVNLIPEFDYVHQTLSYTQGDRRVNLSRNSFLFGASLTNIQFGFGHYQSAYGKRATHQFVLSLDARGLTPDMAWLVDMPYTADPLNITVGAPSLRNQQTYKTDLKWTFSPQASQVMNTLNLNYTVITNMLVRGYRYDTATGIRTIRSYNTSGNWSAGLSNTLSTPIQRVSLSSTTGVTYGQTVDMIGTDAEPSPYRVHNLLVSENLSLQYSPLSWLALTAKENLMWRRTTSQVPGFSTLSAVTSNTSATALVTLPAGFQISTDATLYARRGYGSAELNTTDVVWNARVAWSSPNKQWLLAVDGFDLLHQLSSVEYAVNAQGRTITYTNVLPRYVMFHVQYKLNILPKKK